MTVTTYAGLSTAAFRRLERTAETTPFNDALELVEAEINRRLALSPVRPQHTTSALTIDAELEDAPAGLLDVDTLKITTSTAVDRVLATTPQNMAEMFERDDTTGQPRFYAQVGSQFRFYPAPDASYTGSLTYWAKVPALTSSATTNWLSLAHPDVYFHGVLAHLCQEYWDEKNAERQAALFDLALQKVLDAYPRRQDRAPRHDADLNAIAANRRGFNIFTG
jgi:hypothetical protein